MSFVERQLHSIRIQLAGHSLHERELLIAQQALVWALDPKHYASPLAFILGSPEVAEDYSRENRLPASLETSEKFADGLQQQPRPIFQRPTSKTDGFQSQSTE